MGRFLFVVPPFFGHINPTISVAHALKQEGHEVAWAGYRGIVEKVVPSGEKLFLIDADEIFNKLGKYTLSPREQGGETRVSFGLPGFKFLIEDVFIPMAYDMLPGVENAINDFQPDVVVADHQCFAGVVVALKMGLPWCSFCTTSASVVFHTQLSAKVEEWGGSFWSKLQDDAKVPIQNRLPDSTFPASPLLTVVFSSREFVGGDVDFPRHYLFSGPSFKSRTETAEFPWDSLNTAWPKILVSLGTLNSSAGNRFYHEVMDALGDKEIQVIMVAPAEQIKRDGQEFPTNFIIKPFIPQLAVLAKVDAVLCHGGHNTVVESIMNGLPLIIAPITDDQPIVAAQVVNAKIGLRINFRRSKAGTIADAVMDVMQNPSYRLHAEQMKESFVRAGGAEVVAKRLIALLC